MNDKPSEEQAAATTATVQTPKVTRQKLRRLREREDARLDALERMLLPIIQQDHLCVPPGGATPENPATIDRAKVEQQFEAVDLLLEISERRAKLWGLDAPVRYELVPSEEPTTASATAA